MHFECFAAFRELEGDEDHLDKLLRILRATYWTALAGTLWLMLGSVWTVGFGGRSYEDDLIGLLFYSILIFLYCCSHPLFFSASPRRCFVGPSVVVLTAATGQAVTLLGWWDFREILGQWWMAILIVAVAWFFLWGGEKTVQSRRSRREDLRSPG